MEPLPGTEMVYLDETGELLLQQKPPGTPKSIYTGLPLIGQYRINLIDMTYKDVTPGRPAQVQWEPLNETQRERVAQLIQNLPRNYGHRLIYIDALQSIAKGRAVEHPTVGNKDAPIAEVIAALVCVTS